MIDYESIDKLARNIEQHSFRRGYVSAFTLAAFPTSVRNELELHITRECEGLVYGNAEVGSPEALKACISALDGRVDYIVHDVRLNFDPGRIKPMKSILLPYNDLMVWVESVRYILLALLPELDNKNILCIGMNVAADQFLTMLINSISPYCRELNIYDVIGAIDRHTEKQMSDADIVIGSRIYTSVITEDIIRRCLSKPLIIDAGIGTITSDASKLAQDKGMSVIRVDNRAAMAGMLFSLIQSHDLVTRVMGRSMIDGVEVVAGGIIGEMGAIVVDSIDNPSMVIGFADGTGRIRYEEINDEEKIKLNKVRKFISGENTSA